MVISHRNTISYVHSCAWACCALFCSAGWGQDFRMDTDVFLTTQKEPVAETLTLFSNGRVYDFLLSEPRETVVFDPARGTFTLLDEKQKCKTIVTTQEALDHAFALKVHSQEQPDTVFGEAAAPKFVETSEERTENDMPASYVKLAGKFITYEATGTRPKFNEATIAYSEFATWCARLNAMRMGNLPPEARISLNRALAGKGVLPREITRTITARERFGDKKVEVRSRHLVNWTLSSKDRERIDQTHDAMVSDSFKMVSFDEYRQLQTAAQTAAAK